MGMFPTIRFVIFYLPVSHQKNVKIEKYETSILSAL
jgi:hypothetical protein